MSKDATMRHRQKAYWPYDSKNIILTVLNHFQTVLNSSFCCKGPWSSINQKVRNRKMLDFTSFSITQLEKVTFYVQRLSFYACNNEPSTESLLTVDSKKIFRPINSSFCCKGPWSSINHKVRNRKMLAFTSFSITQGSCNNEASTEISIVFAARGLESYVSFHEASTESLLTVDSKNIIFRPW